MTDSIARPVQERSGWSRIGFAVSLLVVIAAGVVLFHVLRDIDLSKVLDAIVATPVRTIVSAAALVALGYLTMTLYEVFSLRTIGCDHVPYRIAALASFTSYSIGHNLGATVFTAGAVRWRIYSGRSLTVLHIAKMAFVTGLTFWLGNITVLGLALLIEPDAAGTIDQLPAWANRSLGAAGLAVIIGYLLWLMPRPRVVGRGSWAVTLPGARLTLVQIGIGVLDLAAGGLALFMLLPQEPAVDLIRVMVVYVSAIVFGFLSHSPGSLGVFEAAVLIGLPQLGKEELLASLLIFRCLYFLLPMLLAVAIMTVRELMLAGRE